MLALVTSSHPDGGSSAVLPPMDMEDSSLLETGLPGCPFPYTPYRGLLFTDGDPAFGLQLHHPQFLEFVGVPGSVHLLLRSPAFWVDQLGKEQAMAAAVNLQRDAAIMLSSNTVAVFQVVELYVVRDDGLGHRPDDVSSR